MHSLYLWSLVWRLKRDSQGELDPLLMTSCSRIQATSRQNKAVGKKPRFREDAKSETAGRRWKMRAWRTRNCVRRSILHIPVLPWRGRPRLAFAFTQELSICTYVHRQGSKSRSKKGNRQKHSGAIRSAVKFSFPTASYFFICRQFFSSLAVNEFCLLSCIGETAKSLNCVEWKMILENAAEYGKLQLMCPVILSRNALIDMIIVIAVTKFNA